MIPLLGRGAKSAGTDNFADVIGREDHSRLWLTADSQEARALAFPIFLYLNISSLFNIHNHDKIVIFAL